jgi:uncharacterized protein
LITHDCNLRCRYCYVREYKSCSMSEETAKKVIAASFEESKDSYDYLEFVFLGGEPLLFDKRMMKIAEWVWAQEWATPYLLSAVTNGTLLDEENKEWFRENKERFILCLSYDGIQKAQNINRSESDSLIEIDFFLRNWPKQGLKMTISEESVPYLAESIITLQEKGVRVNSSFAGGVPQWGIKSLERLKKQLDILTDYYLEHAMTTPNNLLSINFLPVLEDRKFLRVSCGLGENRVTYDCDGERYSCHLISPLVLRKDQIIEYEQSMEDEQNKECEQSKEYGQFMQKRQGDLCCGEMKYNLCNECRLDGICPVCAGNSIRQFGKPDVRERNNCKTFQIQVRAACKYQLKTTLNNHILNGSQISDIEKKRIKAIKYIMESLSDYLE